MTTTNPRRTWTWTKLRTRRLTIARANQEPCCRCGHHIDYTLPGNHRNGPTVDHYDPIATGGNPYPPLDQLGIAHRHCNSRAGQHISNARQGLGPGSRGGNPDTYTKRKSRNKNNPISSDAKSITPRQGSAFVSDTGLIRGIPKTLSAIPRHPGEMDGVPSAFPDIHPEAVRSRGDEMVAWAEARRGEPLRWWQWLTAQRRYEVRADGSWCWLLVFTSVSRQQGKSVELTEDAAWHGSLGSRALTLHAADRVATARDVQAELWPWAEESGLRVARQLGDSRITWPDGSVWKTIAMGSAYSRRPRRLLVDESWDMDPAQFWNAMFPAMGGQTEPVQALFWSAANPQDKGLVADLRADGSVCRMEWGALPGEDHADPVVWRASSAFWTPNREAQMRAAVGRPGFAENWLNVWPGATVGPGSVVPPDLWASAAREGLVVDWRGAVVGVSFDEASGVWPVVRAVQVPGGAVVVELVGVRGSQPESVAAAELVEGRYLVVPSHGLRGQVRVRGKRFEAHLNEGDALSAVVMAPAWLRGGLLLHEGGQVLTDAVLGVPVKRVRRRWDAGTMALVCAWWAHKQRPTSAVA